MLLIGALAGCSPKSAPPGDNGPSAANPVAAPPVITTPIFPSIAPPIGLTIGESSLWYKEVSNCCEFLRFYSNGTVIGVNATNTPEEMYAQFHAPYENKGTYTVTGSTVKFSLTDSYGEVDYAGPIQGSTLLLTWYSHVNKHRTTETFTLYVPPAAKPATP